jgi:glycosyltransferase involved in cell wall biosynthesis
MPETLKVGFNLTYLVQDAGGSGRYARELIPALMKVQPDIEITAWVGSTAPSDLEEEPWAADVRWLRLPVPGIGSPWHLWYELVSIGFAASRRRLDVMHGMAYLKPLVHPGVASVITIHDVIWLQHPETSGWRFNVVMRSLTPVLGRSCDRIITISKAARDDIAAALHLDAEKFDVIPHGIAEPPAIAAGETETQALRERLGLGPEPIVLCVAAKRRHKNLHGLIRALASLPEPRPQLVLPGSPNAYELELRDLAAELGVQHGVRFPGWVSEADLELLYRLASCFVLPTFQEGFGLPVLEAMARGVPVACSDIPALREVAGDAAVWFDPKDPPGIARAIERLLGDPKMAGELVDRGHERCALFTWERTARATLASYRRALGRG